MKLKSILFIVVILSISIIANAQMKLHDNGGISIGSTTNPGINTIRFYDMVKMNSQLYTYGNETILTPINC